MNVVEHRYSPSQRFHGRKNEEEKECLSASFLSSEFILPEHVSFFKVPDVVLKGQRH